MVNVPEERSLAASLRLLSAASRSLASSFDYVHTLAHVGTLVVPDHAAGLFVAVVDSDGALFNVCTAGTVPTFDDVPSDSSPGVLDFALIARDRTLGVLRVARPTGSAHAVATNRELFEDLAVRIAVAIDSAQIYAREHHVADTLQRALLPDRLPHPGTQHFDAAYLPGAEEAIVGGDWYDAFSLPDGRIAVSIGDVAGHGLRAAIVMGEVRQAFRAAALNPKSPSLVLERANTIMNMRANPVMVTAIFGIIDPTTSTLTYAVAGHPPPVLGMPDGTVQRLPADGIPLGIADTIDARDWTFTLPSGSIIAFYTDGLIEYSRDVIAGEERLLEAMRAEVFEPSATPARSLLRRIFATTKNTDDVAALVVRIGEPPSNDFVFDFTAIPIAVPLVRRALLRYAARLRLDDNAVFALITSVGEATANAVEHAYPEAPGIVRVRIRHTGLQLITTIEDDGRWKPAEKKDERGRGLPLMRALMNGFEIHTHQAQTVVRLTLTLKNEGAGAAD